MTRAIVTDLRREALGHLAEYQYLTTPQFYVLLGRTGEAARRGVRRMLTLLHRAGLVERSRYVVDDPGDRFLRYQHCYRLSRSGRSAVGKGNALAEKSPASLPHELGITAFHIALATAMPPTHRLYWRQTDLKHGVNPDALFAITDATQPRESSTYYYFLEVERSRQGHYRGGESGLLAKLRRYSEYRKSARCLAEWKHFADYRVVVVLANRERQDNLLRALQTKLCTPIVWTTTADDVVRCVTGAVFRAPPDFSTVAHSLFDQRNGEKNVRDQC
jgi:hypothetical protein